MDMDTSFYPKPSAQPQGGMPGPMDYAAKAQALAGGALQLQAQQQMMAAREAIGPIIQQSVDPQSGELNYNKAFVGLASDPRTAWMANDILGQWTQRQLTQQETALKELETHQKKLEVGGNILSSLLPQGDNLRLNDVVGALALLKGQGIIDDKESQAYMNHFTKFGDGAPLARAVQSAVLGLSGSKNAIEQTFGTFGERSAAHPTTGPLGEPGIATTGELLGVKGPGQGGPMQLPGSVLGGGAAAGPENLGGGAVPSRGEPPQAPMARGAGGQPEAGSVPGSPPAFHTTGLPKVYQDYRTGKGEMRDYEKKLTEEQNVINQQLLMINDAEEAMKHFKQGPGMATRFEAAKAMKAMGLNDVAATLMGVGKKDDPIENAQAFQKMMIISSMETLRKTLGGQGRITNLEFEKFEKALPSIETTPGAIRKIFNYMKKIAALQRLESDALVGENGYVQRHLADPYNSKANFSIADFNRRFTAYATKKKLLPSLQETKESGEE